MKVFTYYYRTIGEDDKTITAYCDKDKADGTYFQFTDVLEDGKEFGLTVTYTGIEDEPSEFLLEQVEAKFEAFRVENA